MSNPIIKKGIKNKKMMQLKHPRCDNCGVKIYPIYKRFTRNRWFYGDIPSFCPSCGKEISNRKKAQFDDFRSIHYIIGCTIVMTIAILALTVFRTF